MESLSSIDAAQDFEGYMEHIQQQEADTERMRDMLDRHEVSYCSSREENVETARHYASIYLTT